MILQTSPTSAIVKFHNISREFSMLIQTLRRRYPRVHFRGRVEIIRHRVSREMIFWCCNIFLRYSHRLAAADYFAVHDAIVSRVACFSSFFLRVAFSYLHPETNCVSCLPHIYIHRRLRVSNARRRPSTRFSANDIVITMSWEYWLRAWNAYPK